MTHPEALGAFVPGDPVVRGGAPAGPLAGLTFAAKDLFDVAGHVTGAGNPCWRATHRPAGDTAPAVQALLDAGAGLVGKTILDELAFSLIGENIHYGTPLNPRAPLRVPGGSSSGSAAAVAGAAVDFALGSDTAGSVRIPASLCGLYGFRPSHGRVSTAGMVPLAPSFDAVGWLARDARMLERIGAVLLAPDEEGTPDPAIRYEVLVVEEAFALADPAVRMALAPAVDAVTAALGPPGAIRLAEDGLEGWAATFRVLQGREAWACHGDWITSAKPVLAPAIADRFAWTATLTADAEVAARRQRREVQARLDAVLAEGVLLCLPSVPEIAPMRRAPAALQERFRSRVLCLSCVASLGGLPEVTLPLAEADGCPVGLSLIGRRGADRALLTAAGRISL